MLRYLLTLSRPRFWLYLAGPVLVGVAYGATEISDLFSPLAVVLFAYFLVPANVFLYGVNDVFDRNVDAENPKKQGQREARYRGGKTVVFLVALCGVAGAALALLSPPVAAPWLAGFLFLGYAYSAPPFRLKTKPPLDSLSNGLYVLPGAAAFAAVAGRQPPILAVLAGWLWAMAMHTFSAIPDIEPDRRAGIRTTATVLGERPTLAYCGVCWLLAAGVFALLDWRAGLLLGLYPLFAAGVAETEVEVARAYWWFPAINTVVGMVLTLGGLWGVLRG
ncbi:prenyltransferase [Halorussus halophilus]|uniref:prenyltransferase n=1 Tax=Halorussus halophilus TaxID=2650975 RepID=UPI00130120EA|nr:prenyltransferase [Halorussus halophilus]